MVHVMTKIYLKHIGSHIHVCIYGLSVDLMIFNWMTFDLGSPSKVKLGNIEVILSNI